MTAAADRTPSAQRSFARRWSRRVGIVLAAVTLVALLLLGWLLATPGGRDTLLGRVVGMLPPDSLSWERVEGTLRGPLVFHGLRYRHDGVSFSADRVLLDPQILPTLGRRLQLDRLEVDAALLELPAADPEPFSLPRWPDVLPQLDLPLDIRSTQVVVDGFDVRRGDESLIAIDSLEATGLQLIRGGFSLESLAMQSDRGQLRLRGEYSPARNFRSTLAGTWTLPPQTDQAPSHLQFSSRGDLDDFALDVAGSLPDPLTLELRLKDGAGTPTWSLDARSGGLKPAVFGLLPEQEAVQFDLQATGVGGAMQLQGEVAQGELRIGIKPSRLMLAEGRLEARPLELALAAGDITVTGDAQLEGERPRFDLVVASEQLRFVPTEGEDGAAVVTARGEITARGDLADWTAAGEAVLERGGEQATVTLSGTGDEAGAVFDQLLARTPGGSLDGRGRVRWSPDLAIELDARLAGFDPGYFLPDYPGALDGQLEARANRGDDGAWRGSARLDRLGGQWRGRPVSGRIAADWSGDRGRGEAALTVGGSRIDARGGFGARYDLQARFSPLELADLVAGAGGRLQGTLALRGPANALDIEAELTGESLRWDAHSADTVAFSGTLPARGSAGAFEASGAGLVVSGIALDRLALTGRGSLANLQLELDAAGEHGELDLAAQLGKSGSQWRGRLQQLRLAAAQAPELRLQDGADFAYGPGVLRIDRSCLLAESVGGELCIAATGNEATIEGTAVPLALAKPWLPTGEGLNLDIDGVLDLRADLRRGRDGRWNGEARVDSERGSLRLDQDAEREIFGYRDLDLQLRLAGSEISGQLSALLAAEGSLSARFRTGRDDTAALEGELRLDLRELSWLELFSEDLAAPTGRLQGRLALAGTRGEPALSGLARLQDFTAELPGLGVKLREGEFTLVGEADGSARLDGSVRSGEGLLDVDGSLNFRDATAPLRLVLRGEQITLASTPELYLVANPDLGLRWLEDRLEVRGSLVVPEARVDLEALDSNVSISPDVVVVDPVDAPRRRARPLDLQFNVTLGDSVRLKGFGLDGAIAGQLSLREIPGRRATASGTLEVSGTYRAYGQALTIERARLGFADSPFDNPTLDIRAEREFEQVTVGVQVRGTARRPETTIVSTPAMETSEALSWLVLGRPLSTASGNESQQLGAAALALGAGGNLVAQQLGANLGLDEAGVTDSRNLGGATFTIGKYVSPRLFLSYGVSLVGTGQVVTLKYLLSRGFDISVESGNENAASLNWRTER